MLSIQQDSENAILLHADGVVSTSELCLYEHWFEGTRSKFSDVILQSKLWSEETACGKCPIVLCVCNRRSKFCFCLRQSKANAEALTNLQVNQY